MTPSSRPSPGGVFVKSEVSLVVVCALSADSKVHDMVGINACGILARHRSNPKNTRFQPIMSMIDRN